MSPVMSRSSFWEYAENYSVLVQMPTGTGKTYVMASVVKWFLYFLFFLNVIKEKE